MFKRRTRAGLSFLEIMVTVSIAAILAGTAVVSIGPRLRNQRLQEATDYIQQALQQAQQQALRQSAPWSFAFDPANNRYAIFAGAPMPAAPDWRPVPVGIQANAASTTLPVNAGIYSLRFDDQGFATDIGILQLRDGNANGSQLQSQVQVTDVLGTVQMRCLFGARVERRCV